MFIGIGIGFYNVNTCDDLLNSICCILNEQPVLRSEIICKPCFRRVEVVVKKERVLQTLKSDVRVKYVFQHFCLPESTIIIKHILKVDRSIDRRQFQQDLKICNDVF